MEGGKADQAFKDPGWLCDEGDCGSPHSHGTIEVLQNQVIHLRKIDDALALYVGGVPRADSPTQIVIFKHRGDFPDGGEAEPEELASSFEEWRDTQSILLQAWLRTDDEAYFAHDSGAWGIRLVRKDWRMLSTDRVFIEILSHGPATHPAGFEVLGRARLGLDARIMVPVDGDYYRLGLSPNFIKKEQTNVLLRRCEGYKCLDNDVHWDLNTTLAEAGENTTIHQEYEQILVRLSEGMDLTTRPYVTVMRPVPGSETDPLPDSETHDPSGDSGPFSNAPGCEGCDLSTHDCIGRIGASQYGFKCVPKSQNNTCATSKDGNDFKQCVMVDSDGNESCTGWSFCYHGAYEPCTAIPSDSLAYFNRALGQGAMECR
jgi:hypothetical protein